MFNVLSTIVTRHSKTVIFSTLLLGSVCIFLLFSYTLGNIFFGRIPSLYNVELAQFFFTHAASPIFGKTPQFAHYQLSRTYFIQGDFEKAVQLAHKEIEIYPENVRTYYILGLTYGYMNREEEAIIAFKKFIEANPYSWAARNDCAWLQFRIGDIDGAMETILPVALVHRTNPWVQNTWGTLLLNKEQYAEAKEAFNLAKESAGQMTEESWGRAYPGNDPRIYVTGLSAMKTSIENNLALVNRLTE